MKKLQHLSFALLFIIVIVFVSESVQAEYGYQYEDGGIEVEVEALTGPGNQFYIYRPNVLVGNHPVIVFCVGTFARPWMYGYMLRSYASHGIVVIAGIDGFQRDGDQALEGLDWLITESPYKDMLRTDRILSMGHSQGGFSAMRVWEQDKRVTAILPLMPGTGESILVNGTPVQYGLITVPIFFISGEIDDGKYTNPFVVFGAYNETSGLLAESDKPPVWYGCSADTNHFPVAEKVSLHEMIRAFIYAHLLDNAEAKAIFYLSGTDDNFLYGDWADQARKNVANIDE